MHINPGMPNVSASAYTNNFLGATNTMLFAIEHTADKLCKQNPSKNGTSIETGNPGINIDGLNGFDIGSTTVKAYGILTVSGSRALYPINLTSGTSTNLADFKAGNSFYAWFRIVSHLSFF